jgi:predicted metal-dependent peptidase
MQQQSQISTLSGNQIISAKEKLDVAISRLITFQPLYGVVFMHLNKIESKTIPTMAVGVIRRVDLVFYYNLEFVSKLDIQQITAVLKHEALHVLLHHMSRARHFAYNPKGYNIAADCAINCNIKGLPPNCMLPSLFSLPDNESAEWYYEKLKQQSEEAKKNLEDYLEEKGFGSDSIDDHSLWGDFDDEVVREKIRGIADKAIKEQEKRGWGDIPGNLAAQIVAANKPVVIWQREVRYFINKLILMGRKTTRMRPNRRYGYSNPGGKRDFLSKILVAVDTSGSVSDEELKAFLAEINGMINHIKVDLIQFDHEVKGEPEPFEKKQRTINIVGRGGTNFEGPIALADQLGYDGLIVFTDGYAPFPPKPKCRMLWCVCQQNEKVEFPYGKKVVIEKKKK